MRRRNPALGMVKLWHRLRQRGYTRRMESLFRVMRNSTRMPRRAYHLTSFFRKSQNNLLSTTAAPTSPWGLSPGFLLASSLPNIFDNPTHMVCQSHKISSPHKFRQDCYFFRPMPDACSALQAISPFHIPGGYLFCHPYTVFRYIKQIAVLRHTTALDH